MEILARQRSSHELCFIRISQRWLRHHCSSWLAKNLEDVNGPAENAIISRPRRSVSATTKLYPPTPRPAVPLHLSIPHFNLDVRNTWLPLVHSNLFRPTLRHHDQGVTINSTLPLSFAQPFPRTQGPMPRCTCTRPIPLARSMTSWSHDEVIVATKYAMI